MNKRKYKLFSNKNLLLFVILVMVYFGVRTDEEYTTNRVLWSPVGEGISFTDSSMIYSDNLSPLTQWEEDFLSLELVIKAHYFERPRFGIILQIYDNREEKEITIGQWDKSLMVLNSSDYSNRRRAPKIYAPLDTESQYQRIRILSNDDGTTVVINGEEAGYNPELNLSWPGNLEKTRLILGNGISGHSSWTGTLYSLELQSGTEDKEVWNALDENDKGIALTIPEKISSLERDFLRIPDFRSLDTVTMISDIFWNFFGFIPFGYLLIKNRRRIITVLLLSFLFSLSIEIVQFWLPGRDSSLLDLLLNTAGGVSGAFLAFLRNMKKH